jgi:hypothetical protein
MSKTKRVLVKIGFTFLALILLVWATITCILLLPNNFDNTSAAAFDGFTNFVFFYWLISVFLINYTTYADPRKPVFPINYAWGKMLFPTILFLIPAIISISLYIYTFDLGFLLVALLCIFIVSINAIWTSLFAKIKWLRRDPDAAVIIKNNAIILYDIRHKVPLNSISPELFIEPIEIENIDQYFQAVGYFEHKTEIGEYKTALETAQRLLIAPVPFTVTKKTVIGIQFETLILMVLSEEPQDSVEAFYKNIEQHLKTPGKEITKSAAEYAYFALVKKDIDSAKIARGKFYKCFEQRNDPNDEYEKKLVDEIDRRLSASYSESQKQTSEV